MQSFEINNDDLERIYTALKGDDGALKNVMEDYHPSEIAIIFEKLSPEERERIVNVLPIELASDVISEMDEEHHPEEILFNLDPEKRSDIIEELDYYDATDSISQRE